MGNLYSSVVKNLPSVDQSSSNAYTIYAQGDNSYGTITNVTKQLNIAKLWTGNYQTFALDKNGTLYSWGLNDFYQLGNGKSNNYLYPQNDTSTGHHKFIDTFTILSYEPGYINQYISPQVFPFTGRKIKTIAFGDGFTVFLLKDGTIYSVGRCDKGQLGIDLPFNESTIVSGKKCAKELKEIKYFSMNKIIVTNIACGSDFVFAQDENGDCYSWGNNDHYQLCRDTLNYNSLLPEKVDGISEIGSKISILKCGWMHGCLLTEKGEMYIWGNPYYDYDNSYRDIKKPLKIELCSTKVIDLVCGFHHMCVIIYENERYELYSFGANDFGQLGYETKGEYSPIPKKVVFPEEQGQIAEVILGAFHSICRLNNNMIYGFGQNETKQVGDYTAEYITWPVKYNWKMKEELFLYKILCGNGSTIIIKRNTDEEDAEEKLNQESYVKVLPSADI